MREKIMRILYLNSSKYSNECDYAVSDCDFETVVNDILKELVK